MSVTCLVPRHRALVYRFQIFQNIHNKIIIMLSSFVFITHFVISLAAQLPSTLLITYWGQDDYPNQKRLSEYCDMGYNGKIMASNITLNSSLTSFS